MKILFVINSLSAGGAERVTANLANHWAAKGVEVTIVTLTEIERDFYALDGNIKRVSKELSSDSRDVISAILNNLNRILFVRKVLNQIRPDVAIAMMDSTNVLLAIASIGLHGLITIGSEHTHPPMIPLGRIWEGLRSRFYGKLSVITALTDGSANWIKQNTNAKRVVVIPNAVSWPLTSNGPFLDPNVASSGKKILLAVGRLSKEKGFDRLIVAYSKIARKFPDWKMIVIGDGPDRNILEAMVREYSLSESVLFPGRAGNMSDWYDAAALYVMSSRFEGFGNTLAEALAHGVPCVSFNCDMGPRTIIRDNVDGFLVPEGNVEAMRDALEKLMTNEVLRKNFSTKALDARERFSIKKIASMWEDLF